MMLRYVNFNGYFAPAPFMVENIGRRRNKQNTFINLIFFKEMACATIIFTIKPPRLSTLENA